MGRGRFLALSYEFEVATNVAGLAPTLESLLAPFRLPTAHAPADPVDVPRYDIIHVAGRPQPYTAELDGEVIDRSRAVDVLVGHLIWAMSRDAVAGVHDYLALHAGVVSRDGIGVLLPAPPGAGKTTLTAGLVEAGFDYLSDEVGLVGEDRRVHPFPRPLTMAAPSMELFGDLRSRLLPLLRRPGQHVYPVRAEDIRAGSVGSACRAGFVIAPHYRSRHEGATLEAISRAEAITILGENSFNFRRFGGRGLELLRDVVSRARCYRLVFGELGAAVRTVDGLLPERAVVHAG